MHFWGALVGGGIIYRGHAATTLGCGVTRTSLDPGSRGCHARLPSPTPPPVQGCRAQTSYRPTGHTRRCNLDEVSFHSFKSRLRVGLSQPTVKLWEQRRRNTLRFLAHRSLRVALRFGSTHLPEPRLLYKHPQHTRGQTSRSGGSPVPKSAGPQQGFHSNRSGLSDGGENSGQGTAGTLRSRKLLLYAKYTLPGTPACVFGGAGGGGDEWEIIPALHWGSRLKVVSGWLNQGSKLSVMPIKLNFPT